MDTGGRKSAATANWRFGCAKAAVLMATHGKVLAVLRLRHAAATSMMALSQAQYTSFRAEGCFQLADCLLSQNLLLVNNSHRGISSALPAHLPFISASDNKAQRVRDNPASIGNIQTLMRPSSAVARLPRQSTDVSRLPVTHTP